MEKQDYILTMENITMKFPGVLALDDVSLNVRKGTVHALMGENGAGKSTLMKILIGIYKPTKGIITFKGKKLSLNNTNEALKSGIAMIHQELSPIPYMSVAENIFLGREVTNGLFVNMKAMEQQTEELFKKLNITGISPKQKMKELSIASSQMVEIAKAISYNSDLIIMDEPTSAITEKEVDHLFKMIADLKKRDISIIYITHKMDELFKIADDVTVLRDGKFIDYKPASALNKDSLIELMVGRELKNVFDKKEVPIGEVILSVKNYTKQGKFYDISFELRRGEILGIAGLMGAGRSEVMESVFGVVQPDSGEIFIKGKKVNISSPEVAIKNKMAFLTEDRKGTGLFLMLSVKDNIVVSSLNQFKKGPLLDDKKIDSTCNEEIKKFLIKTPNANQKIGFLSGGNQQKALISRWMLTSPDILILDEPTRGIDVGAKAEIHKLMSDLAGQGKAVIMISSELPEIIGMSDRVLVMHEGYIMAELNHEELTQERILSYAAGETSVS